MFRISFLLRGYDMFKNFYWQLLLFYWCPMTLETDINISLISFLCSGELINIPEAQEQV